MEDYKRQERRSVKGAADDVIFVGKKPTMFYVLGVVTQFGNGQKEIHIKARGRAISKAVDVAEIVRKKFVTDTNFSGIKIGTEEITAGDEKINVSIIEISMKKQN